MRAVVVRKHGQVVDEGELTEHCRQRLASFKRPESVVFVDELPRNPLGEGAEAGPEGRVRAAHQGRWVTRLRSLPDDA